jgi:penicillin amidase
MSSGTRRRWSRTIRIAATIAAASLAALIVVALVAFAWIVRAPIPKVDGSIAVAGISGPVTIRRDDRGIPHVVAQTETDLFFGDGYACAQDRLWQMDILRRESEGRLSQIFGSVALPLDRYYLALGIGAKASSDAAHLDARTRADFDAYAAGVNAYAAASEPALEFRLLGYRPAPWTAVDSLAIVKLMEQRLDDEADTIAVRAKLASVIGDSAMRALTTDSVPALEHPVPGYGSTGRRASLVNGATSHDVTGWALAFSAPAGAERVPDSGSNGWTVSGRRTTTGLPVLSNDTHLEHSVPSTWWVVQLKGAGFDVEGFTIPGLPGVTLGHNERIAFGVTSAYGAAQDLFAERFRDARSDEYRYGTSWLRAHHRIESIPIKGKLDATLDVLETIHGPVVIREGAKAYALSWTALRDPDPSRGQGDLDRASDWAQFRAAVSELVGPNLNFVYADVDGHIGYQDAGRLPVRQGFDGWLPADGSNPRLRWTGDVPFAKLPHAFDPPAGFLASANNQLTSPGYSPQLSTALYAPPYRIQEITRLMGMTSFRKPSDYGAMQSNPTDIPDAELAAATVLALQDTQDAMLSRIRGDLAGWNGNAEIWDRTPTFIAVERDDLTRDLLEPKLGSLYAQYKAHFHPITIVDRALRGDRSLASLGVTRTSVIATISRAVREAVADLKMRPDQGIDSLRPWGEVDAAVFDHPLGVVWPLNTLLNFKPLPQPGDPYTIFQAKPDFGPSMRLVADTHDWDDSSMVLTLGESGHFSDEHYDDQMQDWVNNRYRPTPFSDDAVARATRHILVLEPKP